MLGSDHNINPAGVEESASRMTAEEAPAAGAEAGWKLEGLRVRKAENGGVIVTCEKRRDLKPSKGQEINYDDRYQSKDYAFTNADEALAFMGAELAGAEGAGNGGGAVQAAPSRY